MEFELEVEVEVAVDLFCLGASEQFLRYFLK